MEPVAPFSKVFEWSQPAVVATAALLGIGFGFFLEMAGFGNAKMLAGQWYGYNFAVLRVMFTAIVVAMVLIFFASRAMLLDFDRLYVNPTYLWSGIVGGLLLGCGFIIGGY